MMKQEPNTDETIFPGRETGRKQTERMVPAYFTVGFPIMCALFNALYEEYFRSRLAEIQRLIR